MGISAGFIPPQHKYYRFGTRLNPDPAAVHPLLFSEEIGSDDYVEYWSDELQIFHNPNALNPLSEDVFSGVTQHYFRDGEQYSLTPENTILASRTMILHIHDGDEEAVTV